MSALYHCILRKQRAEEIQLVAPRPATHGSHATLASSLHVPPTHSPHWAAPAWLHVPAEQLVHDAAPALLYCPAPQESHFDCASLA